MIRGGEYLSTFLPHFLIFIRKIENFLIFKRASGQMTFMEQLIQPNKLRERIRICVEQEIRTEGLPPQSGNVLKDVLYLGELPRGCVADTVGMGDRQARRVVSALVKKRCAPIKDHARTATDCVSGKAGGEKDARVVLGG